MNWAPNNIYKVYWWWLFLISIILSSCGPNSVYYEYEDNFDYDLDPTSEYILIIGDIQEYTMNAKYAQNYMLPTINWIRSMKAHGYKIDCVLHTGDITNNNENWQYGYFQDLTKALADEILFVTVTGNHDYDWSKNSEIKQRESSKMTRYASFDLTCQNIVAQFETGRLDNIVVKNTIHGERYDILALEFGPRPEVLEWANEYVKSHPEHNFILLNHEFLETRGWRVSDGWSKAEKQFLNIPFCTPKTVWDNLINDNDNIRCVVCGHNGFSQLNHLPNALGRKVPQIMFNLQYLPHGGNGMIEVWEIPQSTFNVKADVISTKTNLPYTEYQDSIFDYRKAHFTFSL